MNASLGSSGNAAVSNGGGCVTLNTEGATASAEGSDISWFKHYDVVYVASSGPATELHLRRRTAAAVGAALLAAAVL